MLPVRRRTLAVITAAAVALGVAPFVAASATTDGEPSGTDGADSICTAVRSAGSLDEAFGAAAGGTGVPVNLLKAVAYMESRWNQHPGAPSADGGYGLFNLAAVRDTTQAIGLGVGDPEAPDAGMPAVELERAAALAGVTPADARRDARTNLCAGAALLASYQAQAIETGLAAPGSLPRAGATDTPPRPASAAVAAEWKAAVSRMNDSEDFTTQVYETLRDGAAEVTPDGDTVILEGTPDAVVPQPGDTAGATPAGEPDCPDTIDCEWLPAPYAKHDASAPDDTGEYGNHDQADRTGEGGPSLDYIVIHDTEGSYQTSVNLVQDPTYLGWHYTIRSEDGHTAHHVDNADIGWHAGNWYMNTHSIGIEHEGYAGTAGWYTESMYQASAKLVRHLAERYDIPLDRAHVIGHDQVPGILEGYTQDVHWDPGPYWDWDHYMELLGAPIGGGREATTDVAPGDVVEVRTGYADNPQTVTGCALASPGSGPCVAGAGTNFLYLHQEPSSDAPLARDPGWKPGGEDGTTYASDISARVQSGHKLVVDEVDGEWLGVWWAGAKAWLHNPASRPVVVPTTAETVTVVGDAPAPVYGRAYPEEAAYESHPGVPVQEIGALEYQIGVGQSYAVADADVPTDYYRAASFDGTGPGDRTDVTGETRYYQVWLAHKQFFVNAADVELHEPSPGGS